MAGPKRTQLALPITVAVCEPGPEAPVPDWRPGVPIAEDHYAGPPLPEPKKKRVLARNDFPPCPKCGANDGIRVQPDGPHLFCHWCAEPWKGTEEELARGRRALRAEERHRSETAAREGWAARNRYERQRVAAAAGDLHLAEATEERGVFRFCCGERLSDPSGLELLVRYLPAWTSSDVSTAHTASRMPTCQGCIANAPTAWAERLKREAGHG